MKKESLYKQLSYAYFYITIIATLLMIYLKVSGEARLTWVEVFAPVWGSIALGLLFTTGAILLMKYYEKTNN